MCKQAYKTGFILFLILSYPLVEFKTRCRADHISNTKRFPKSSSRLKNKMNIIQCFFISLFFGCNFIESIRAYGDNVCSRMLSVTYTDYEYELVSVPFTEKNWYGRRVTRWRTEYQSRPKVNLNINFFNYKFYLYSELEGMRHSLQNVRHILL